MNIFDKEAFEKELDELAGKSAASKADTIAHRTKKTIKKRMDDDPAFYARFSKMLEDAIEAFRQQRLADAEYLAKVSEIADSIRTRRGGTANNADVQNQMKNAIEDFLQEVEPDDGALSFEAIDLLLEKCLDMSEKG